MLLRINDIFKLMGMCVLPGMLSSAAFANQSRTVTMCVDADPPPSAYWKRDSQGNQSTLLVGYSVDLFRAAFERLGFQVKFEGRYPWARCMHLVEHQQIDFAMNAYYDTGRASRFDYSQHYTTMTPQVFFRKEDPVHINDVTDLKKYKGCGLNGWSYVHYGLTPKELELTTSYDSLIAMLQKKRCDYFVEELEVIAGYRMMGTDYLSNPWMSYAPVPGAKPPAHHLMAAKGSDAARMLPELNKIVIGLVKSGYAAKSWKSHAGDLKFNP